MKNTIVDVTCVDQKGRIFIVEMQMDWGTSFMQRLLFGAAQAYVKQLRAGEGYHLLHDVYGLGLIDDVFDKESEDWYHHYGMVRVDNPQKAMIDGLPLHYD
jgi:predicted transposase/invertase (TIGR01784 family)